MLCTEDERPRVGQVIESARFSVELVVGVDLRDLGVGTEANVDLELALLGTNVKYLELRTFQN